MNKEKPNVLVLSSGGLKGFLQLGAIHELINYDILDNIDCVVGCSVGSVIGLLFIIGCDPIKAFLEGVDINLLPDDFKLDFFKIISKGGVFDMNFIKKKLSSIVEEIFGYIPTLKELYTLSGINFFITVSNITLKKVEYINHEDNPNLLCIDAVLMSCCIPILFEEIEYNGFIYRDGALCNPFPIDLFDDSTNIILGICSQQETNLGMGFLTNISNTINLPLIKIKDLVISKKTDKCLILTLRVTDMKSEMVCDNIEKLHMYEQGKILTRIFIEQNFI